jgi:hypothetical protein
MAACPPVTAGPIDLGDPAVFTSTQWQVYAHQTPALCP